MDDRSIAIMQPYFFPYIGYFQLIQAVDVFVFYDDVNYINRGWINRNNILVNHQAQLISIPCKQASQNKLINEVELGADDKTCRKLLSTIQMAYKKAPFFPKVFPIFEKTLSNKDFNIAQLASRSVKEVATYLGLSVIFKNSSEHFLNRELKKADRLIDICHQESILNYVNPPGGRELYTQAYFSEKKINLRFLIPKAVTYPQYGKPFVPWLSILDVLMFNDKEIINNELLNAYDLE
ncbi:MAG: WbqC family protein [Bacteroidota bacterium]|nr:WbqC family protein [Bacteroidota bacterium]